MSNMIVKQHDNIQKFPNATSITSSVRLDKTLAVPIISLVLTMMLMSDRKIQTNKV